MHSCAAAISAACVIVATLSVASSAEADALRLFPSYRSALPPNHPVSPVLAALAAGDRPKARRLILDLVAKQPTLAPAHDLHGFLLAEDGNLDGAAAAFNKALRITDRPRVTHGALAEVLFMQGKYTEAKRMLNIYVQAAPADINSYALLGRIAELTGDDRGAVRNYERLLPASEPQGYGALRSLVVIHIRQNEIGKAQGRMKECQGECRTGPGFTLVSALMARAEGRAEQAEQQLTSLAKSNGDLPEVWWELGALQRDRRDMRAAEASFRKLSSFAGWKPVGDLNLATVRLQQGNFAAALALLEPLVRIKAMPDAYALAAETQAAMGDKTRPGQTLKALTTDYPAWGQGHLLLGLWQLSVNQTAPGKQSLETAVKLQPALVQGWMHLSNLAAAAHQYPVAERLLKDGLATSPNSPDLHFQLANTYEQTAQWAAAAGEYAHALRVRPEDTWAMVNRGRTLARAGQSLDEAEKLIRRAYTTNKDNLVAGNLGWVLTTRGNFTEGMPLLQGALAKDPKNAELHYYLATAHQKQGRAKEAAEELRLAREYGLPAEYVQIKP
jgi:predicted Zn-dependent protease